MSNLTAGSIAFTGYSLYDSTGNRTGDFNFVAFGDIAAGTVIHLTDNNWNGGQFSTGESTWSWTATSDIPAGTVVTLSNLSGSVVAGTSATSNFGTITYSGVQYPDLGGDTYWAYTGDAASPVFLAAISDYPYYPNQNVLDNTGLVAGVTATNLSSIRTSVAIAAYQGPTSGFATFADYEAALANPANWSAQGYTGSQNSDGTAPDLPLPTNNFSVDPTVQTIAFAPNSINLSTTEGQPGDNHAFTFTVTRSGSTSGAVNFSGSLVIPAGSGIDAADFGGSLPSFAGVIAAGESSATVTIPIAGDIQWESDETFQIKLDSASNPSAATNIGGASVATATIVNDDEPEVVDFTAASRSISLAEGNSGSTTVTFTIERTGSTIGDLYFTAQGYAAGGNLNADDFGGSMPTAFSGAILDGQSTATISVTFTGDTRYEADEYYQLQLLSVSNDPVGATISSSGKFATLAILNDDPAPTTVTSGTTIEGQLTLTGSGHITVQAGGLVQPAGTAILWSGTSSGALIDNYGTIAPVGGGTAIGAGTANGTLEINNHLGGQLLGTVDLSNEKAGSVITLNNEGLMYGGSSYPLRLAVQGGTAIINNLATGVIRTNATSDVIKNGGNAWINNWGEIYSDPDTPTSSGGDALSLAGGPNNVVHNYRGGLIEGSHHAVTGGVGMTVINDRGGVMIGRNGSAVNIDNNGNPANTVYVTNYGEMDGESANYSDSDGDAIDVDGLLHLDNYGVVQGLGANGYHDGEPNVSEGVAIGGGVIDNYAGGKILGYGRAIQVDDSSNGPAFGPTTIYNEGLIEGYGNGPTGVSDDDAAAYSPAGKEGINIIDTFADTITNKGRIIGAVNMGGGDDILTNTGRIQALAAGAIDMGDGNDTVMLGTGSKVTGLIALGAGNDTITLSKSAVTIDAGGGDDTVIAAAGTLVAGDAIDGGNGTDTLALQGGGVFNLRRQATLANFEAITAQEGRPAFGSEANSMETLYLRDGFDGVVNVAAAPADDNPQSSTITIIGAHDAAIINLASGNDTVVVGDARETIHGGSGVDTISVTASTIGATIDGGSSGRSLLIVKGGGTLAMGDNITTIGTVNLAASGKGYDFTANGIAGLTVRDGSASFDTLRAGGLDQTLTGGGAGKLTMVGFAEGATTFENAAAKFNGDTIEGFDSSDFIHLTGLVAAGTVASFVQDNHAGADTGTLDVFKNGHLLTAITLFGQYAGAFTTSADSSGTGTLITYEPLSPHLASPTV